MRVGILFVVMILASVRSFTLRTSSRSSSSSLKMASLYDFKLKDMTGVEQSMSKYRGNVVLVENVASL